VRRDNSKESNRMDMCGWRCNQGKRSNDIETFESLVFHIIFLLYSFCKVFSKL